MKFKKKAMFACVIAFLGAAVARPALRDELAWYWAGLQDNAPGYELYYIERPNGMHVAEARLRYKTLTWNDTKRAMIADAIKKHTAAQSDPNAKRERRARMETFWWKQVTSQNALFGYQDYLQRYPNGQHAGEARRRIVILNDQNPTEPASSWSGH